MTVENQLPPTTTSGDGITVTFPFNFKILREDDLTVIQTIVATGEETQLTIAASTGTDGNPAGGTITLAAAPPPGSLVTVDSRADLTQPQVYDGNELYPETVEQGLDRLTVQNQRQQKDINRGMRFHITDDAAPSLPPASQRKNKLVGFDADGVGIEMIPGAADIKVYYEDAIQAASDANDAWQNIDANLDAINAVVSNAGNIDTVADNIGIVNTVAANIGDVNSIVAMSDDIATVSGIADEFPALADIAVAASSSAAAAQDSAQTSEYWADQTNAEAQNFLGQVMALVVTAQNSAAAAEAASNAIPRGMVKRLVADYVIPFEENGYHYVIDATMRDVTLQAPLGANAGEPFRFSVQRAESSPFTVRIVPAGTDVFNDGLTELFLPYINSGASLALDVDTDPDSWAVAAAGALSQLQERSFYFTAQSGQTVFSGEDDFGRSLGYVPGGIEVYRSAVRIWPERGDFSANDGLSIVLALPLDAGEELSVIARAPFATADGYSKQEIDRKLDRIPNGEIGQIAPFASDTPPNGWLLCDGTEISRIDYDALFAAIGTVWGAGDGATTFNLPDLRGEFLRGASADYPVGGAQLDQMQRITGDIVSNTAYLAGSGAFSSVAPASNSRGAGTNSSQSVIFDSGNSPDARVGDETRPRNRAVTYAIKAIHWGRVPTPGPSGVNRMGDTMAGPLVLAHDGALPLEPATKRQLDAIDAQTDFALIYPRGAGGTIAKNERLIVPNPWPGHRVRAVVELYINGGWGDPGFMYSNSPGGYGTKANQFMQDDGADDIIIQSGNVNISTSSIYSGSPHGSTANAGIAPFRVALWKVKGASV